MIDYDVTIVGGGMVGSAAAVALGHCGLRVAVVEARVADINLDDDAVDLRVSAVSRASQMLLSDLGAWQRIDPQCMAPFREMRVWDCEIPPESADVVHFDAADIAEAELGFIVENRRLLFALHRQLDELDNVSLIAPAVAERLISAENEITLRLDDGRRLRSYLVIGADGASSRTRELAGIDTQGWSYQQKAVVTHVTTREPHRDTAYQRFLASGPIALLPLYDGRCSVVWSTEPAQADALLAMNNSEFHTQLSAATDHVLGDITDSDQRAAFPLQLLHAVSYVQDRLLLLGDAAHAVHPLAGQGVNLGFADTRVLAELLAGVDAASVGDLALLRRYERRRKSDNLLVMGSLDALHRLFRQQTPLTRRARQIGMKLFNQSGPLKKAVIRRAMGS